MAKVIVFTENGQTRVVHPAPKCKSTLKKIAKEVVPKGIDYRITDISNLPKNKDYRDAWTDENPTETVDIDIEKAKKIYMDKVRERRNKLLEVLDIETLKGLDVQDEKQLLRDLPQTIDLSNIKTIEELEAFDATIGV